MPKRNRPSEQHREAICRTLETIKQLACFQDWFTLSEMAEKTGFSLSSQHYHLNILVDEGLVEYRRANNRYRRYRPLHMLIEQQALYDLHIRMERLEASLEHVLASKQHN